MQGTAYVPSRTYLPGVAYAIRLYFITCYVGTNILSINSTTKNLRLSEADAVLSVNLKDQ